MRLAGLALTVVSLVLGPAAPSLAADQPPKLLGWTADGSPQYSMLDSFEQTTGKYPAFIQLYWSVTGDWASAAALNLYAQRGVIPYVELTAASLSQVTTANLQPRVAAIAAWLDQSPSHHILIAPFPEANLDDHPWGGNPSGYKSAYRKVRQAFIDAGATPSQVRFVFAMNGWSSAGLSYDDFYPGDAEVDIIGFARLNRNNPWQDYKLTFLDYIRKMQSEVTRAKPILITQTGSVESGGKRPGWLNDMFSGLKAEEQVMGAIYFNKDRGTTNFMITGNGSQPALIAGYQSWAAPSANAWIFDGRMDAWVDDREDRFPFLDTVGSSFEQDILWMVAQGITSGCDANHFCPNQAVTRGQMATFLNRALGLPAASRDWFDDDNGSVHEDAINRLAESGVTGGCGTRAFCPNQSLTRAQMATFLARAYSLGNSPTNWFTDDDGIVHEPNINRVAEARVTLGCGGSHYCPWDAVTRGQMAAFLHRADSA